MKVRVFEDKVTLGKAAANDAAITICRAIQDHGRARIIVATGASQLEFLGALTKADNVDWQRVEMFHLDEYLKLPSTHRASFRRYLQERFIAETGITNYHLLDGNANVHEVIGRVAQQLTSAPIDIAFVGIGENGHLAFNDPPADFLTEQTYLVVDLDEPCRRQQVGEGWFSDISEVPRQAISMSVRQILKAKEIVCVVPDSRKAKAIQSCLEGEITPMAPASILQSHPNTTVYLDRDSASLLDPSTLAKFAETS